MTPVADIIVSPSRTIPQARADGQVHSGLSSQEAARRLNAYGPNEIEREPGTPFWRILARQFNSPVVWLLAGACVISSALGEAADAIVIAAIVVLNGCVGFFQEHRAERAILALRSMTAPRGRVLRDGRTVTIPTSDIVPGDTLVLEAGDIVAADAHLVEANVLSINEAALTGESIPVEKSVAPVPTDAPLAERYDCVFMGTSVAAGTAIAEVMATGMRTELGRIAQLLATAENAATPLQQRLARVSQVLLYICLTIVAVVAGAGWIRGWAPLDVLLAAVSLAVAAVPEGLPAIVTIALAIGVQRMASQNVLIRRLAAVETLGCATVICTDKTGTLTTGVMAVREVWARDHERLLFAAAACCDAELNEDERGGVGDPTELAILMAAAERDIRRVEIERRHPRVRVHPFDAARKRMSIARADGFVYVKGALEVILPLSVKGGDGAAEAHAEMAARGLRVLAIATGRGLEETDLEMTGLIGIADPPRTEAIAAVAAARAAGITTVMITGDHALTARTIARELGILRTGDRPDDVVHARATPEEKLQIVRTWKARGAVVAMTGDGVNDAPALREAHIGIAMGRTGTEVTREASDMILTDDNFASIVAAVREGRGIFDNIRKTLVYLLAGNTGELAVMLVAAVVGLPLPLLPLHLLWINVVTDGLPALALVMDPTEANVLARPPRRPDEPMLGRAQWNFIILTGLLEATATLAMFVWALPSRHLIDARNLAFSTLVFSELFRAFAARSTTRTFWEVGAFTNLRLLGVVVVSVLVQLAIQHMPVTQAFFEIGTLSLSDCGLTVLAGLCPVTVIELHKLFRRAGQQARTTHDYD
jgi:Ca2+-transporting ATPase